MQQTAASGLDAANERKLAEKLESHARDAEAAKKQFNRLRDLCVGAQQVTLFLADLVLKLRENICEANL